MNEPVIIGDCTLFHGDAREIAMEIEKVNCVATDPPYRLISGGNTAHPDSMQGGWMKDYRNTGSPVHCDIEWSEIMEVISSVIDVGDCYVMANNRNVGPAWVAAMDAGLKEHNLFVWDKITATANRWYMKNLEYIWYLYKGPARTINDCSTKQLFQFFHKDLSKNPTEKPVELMKLYIQNSTDVGEVVCDPFMGSGSSGVACVRTGRKFIGIEIEDRWFDVACERIARAQRLIKTLGVI